MLQRRSDAREEYEAEVWDAPLLPMPLLLCAGVASVSVCVHVYVCACATEPMTHCKQARE